MRGVRRGCALGMFPLVKACSDGGLHNQLVGQRPATIRAVRFGAGIGGDSGLLQVKQPILATRWWKCSSCFIEWRLLVASPQVKQQILASG